MMDTIKNTTKSTLPSSSLIALQTSNNNNTSSLMTSQTSNNNNTSSLMTSQTSTNNSSSQNINNNNNNNNNNTSSTSSLNTSNSNNINNNIVCSKVTGWWTLPCKHIAVYIGKNGEICRWGMNTTLKMKRKTGLTKTRYDRKLLINVFKFSFLVSTLCNDNRIYYNEWLYYNESQQQATVTGKLFQQHNNAKFSKEIIQAVWKETRKTLKEWLKLVCVITFKY